MCEEGVLPQETLLPHLLNPSQGPARGRSGTSPPNDTAKVLWLKHAYSGDHVVYVWQRPLLWPRVSSPDFRVAGLEFYFWSELKDDAVGLYLYARPARDSPPRLVACQFIGVAARDDGNRRRSDGFARKEFARPSSELAKGFGYEEIASYSECYLDPRRLFGPKRGHLRFQISVRVEGPCRLQLLQLLQCPISTVQYFELRLPAVVLELREFHSEVRALGVDWTLTFFGTAPSVRMEAKLPAPPQRYELSAAWMPPPNASSLPASAVCRATISETPCERWPLSGTATFPEVLVRSRASLVWPGQEVVFQCCLRSTSKNG